MYLLRVILYSYPFGGRPPHQYHTLVVSYEIQSINTHKSRLVESTHHKKIAVIYFITAIYIALSGRGLSSIIRIEIMGGRVLGDGHV